MKWTWLDLTRLDSTRLDSTRLDSTRLDSTRLDSTWLDSTSVGNKEKSFLTLTSARSCTSWSPASSPSSSLPLFRCQSFDSSLLIRTKLERLPAFEPGPIFENKLGTTSKGAPINVWTDQSLGVLGKPKYFTQLSVVSRHDQKSRQPMNLKQDVSIPVPPFPFLTSL